MRSTRVAVSDLVFDTLEASRDRGVVPLGSAFPSPALFPWTKLARYLGSSARRMDPWNTVESLPPGSSDLRRQIARRYLRLGMNIGIEEIVITAGALEGLNSTPRKIISMIRTRAADLCRMPLKSAYLGALAGFLVLGVPAEAATWRRLSAI